jgi:hypothetical protein
MGACGKRTIAEVTMLNLELWTSFDEDLSASDVTIIEKRLKFLRDTLENAASQYHAKDIGRELSIGLYVYLKYFEIFGDTELSPWLIHDCWFYCYDNGKELNPELKAVLGSVFVQSQEDLHLEITGFLKCLDCDKMILKEADAAVWLSFLDHMASRIMYQIGRRRLKRIFDCRRQRNLITSHSLEHVPVILNSKLWTSFKMGLSASDVVLIEKRLNFLRDILENAATEYYVINIYRNLDLDLHVYWIYFELDDEIKLSPGLVYEDWLSYCDDDGDSLNPELKAVLRRVFESGEELSSDVVGFLKCLECGEMIAKEVDAIVWLSFLDYMASRIIRQIGNGRLKKIFD